MEMEQEQMVAAPLRSTTSRYVVLAVVLSAAIASSIVYVIQNKQSNDTKASLQAQINSLTSDLASAKSLKATSASESEQEAVHSALLLYLQSQGAGAAQKDPMVITAFKQSGDFARFSSKPAIYINELDPAFGFAKKTGGNWTILTFGTGGDPTQFYQQNNIPKDLRDAGY